MTFRLQVLFQSFRIGLRPANVSTKVGMLMNCRTIGLLVVLAAASANSQSGATTFGYARFAPPALSGAPYSGEQVSETVQVLGDGTRITRKTAGQKMFRDFAGRTRVERLAFPKPVGAPVTSLNDIIVVEIYDPILGMRYTLDTVNHIAHRQKLETGPRPSPPPAVNPSPAVVVQAVPAAASAVSARPKISTDSLGTQIINGVQAEGHRITQTIPIDAQGNDRPMSVITETWDSPELKLRIMSKRSDPRTGENTTQILDINRAEPDPSLFTIPAGYTLVDETGEFTIRYGQ